MMCYNFPNRREERCRSSTAEQRMNQFIQDLKNRKAYWIAGVVILVLAILIGMLGSCGKNPDDDHTEASGTTESCGDGSTGEEDSSSGEPEGPGYESGEGVTEAPESSSEEENKETGSFQPESETSANEGEPDETAQNPAEESREQSAEGGNPTGETTEDSRYEGTEDSTEINSQDKTTQAATTEKATNAATEEDIWDETEEQPEPTTAHTATEATTEAVLDSITIKAKKSEYDAGYKLTKSDLTVTAKYTDGSTKTLTSGYTIKQTNNRVYVTYQGVRSNTINISYKAEETTEANTTTEAETVLKSITVKANQSQYEQGYQLVNANLTVTAHYSDGTTGTVSRGYTIHQTGSQLYVTYAGVKSNTITISYEKTLTGINIASKVAEYEQGYQLVSANLTVTLNYSDGSTQTLANGYQVHQTGDQVYVTYDGIKSNTITINYAAASRVTITPKEESYLLGDVITIDDFIVTVHQIDGSSEVVTEGLTLICNDGEINSVLLKEYIGDIYMMYGYSFKVQYKGFVSESVTLPVRYEDGVWLSRYMLDKVNEARIEAGLSELHWDSEAEEEILTRAQELAVSYSHTRPSGDRITDLYADMRGENISKGHYDSQTTPLRIFESWMGSAGHKACILNSSSLTVGFVCAYCIDTLEDGSQMSYWVMWTTFN